jgi:hypothetical protein
MTTTPIECSLSPPGTMSLFIQLEPRAPLGGAEEKLRGEVDGIWV